VVFPLSEDEVVWLLRPERERWERQLRLRPVGGGTSGQYDDYAYSELWYDRFTSWKTRERVHLLEIPFQPELLAKVACADPKPAG